METHGKQEQGLTNLRVTASGLMTWVAFILPSEGSQMPWVPLVTHGPRLIRLPFLPRTNLYSLLLLNNSFPDTGASGCHPRLKPTQTMLCILESPGRFLFSFFFRSRLNTLQNGISTSLSVQPLLGSGVLLAPGKW